MCGIAGQVGRETGSHSLPGIQRALDQLAHRGPDDAGALLYSPREEIAQTIDAAGRVSPLASPSGSAAGVALGHRRLAIIDPSPAGHQPMATPDGRFVLALNGEIYNYRELRRELEALGIGFRSRSDTEVLLHAWATWGPACLPRLVGMFAFVLLDLAGRQLILARDVFGQKPLYHAATLDGFAFASEIGALLQLAGVSRRADPQRIYDYLDLGITDHGDRTMFADVRSLPAAHWAQVSLDNPKEIRPVCYWKPDLGAHLDLSFEAAARRLRDLFVESVDMRANFC